LIEILPWTEKNPLNMIGFCAGVCWNSPVDNMEKNIKRAKECIMSGHGRVAEYPDIYMVINGYSARCIRELYTHIIGTTRLQSSTRYVNAKNMDVENEFYYPETLSEENKEIYKKTISEIMNAYAKLEDSGLPKEDAANLLPLGMHSKIVFKINLRALIHFANMRLCSRSYREIRTLTKEIKNSLYSLSDEWAWICDNLLVPKCFALGYCDEAKSCGLKPAGLKGLKEKALNDFAKDLESKGLITNAEEILKNYNG